VIEDPVLRQRYSFNRSRDEQGNEVLHVETWVDPGGGVTPHAHPAMEERFRVLAGRPSFLAGRRWRTAAPGETVVVPACTRHAYRNRSGEPVHFVCDVTPPLTLEQFLEELGELSRAGKLSSRGLPRTPAALLEAAALAERHREMVVLGFPPMPPAPLQRLLFPVLARLHERRSRPAGLESHGGVL